jgi:hypothetical protein
MKFGTKHEVSGYIVKFNNLHAATAALTILEAATVAVKEGLKRR